MSSNSAVTAIVKSVPKYDNWGIVISCAGILILLISLSIQYSIINHGSSGQIVIDTSLTQSAWIIGSGTLLLLIGVALYLAFNTSDQKYNLIFILAFSSYFISNMAVLFSLYQVNLSTV
jgi:hypothetical protein